MKQHSIHLIPLITLILATSYANASLVIDSGLMTVTAGGHDGGLDLNSEPPVVVPALPDVTESLTLDTNAVGEHFVEAINSDPRFLRSHTFASNLLIVDSNSFVFDGIAEGTNGGPTGDEVLIASSSGEIDFTLHQTGGFSYSSLLGPFTGLSITTATQGEIFACGYILGFTDDFTSICSDLNGLQLNSDSYTIQYAFRSDVAAGTPFDNALSFSVVVPLPASIWLFLSGMTFMASRGVLKNRKKAT